MARRRVRHDASDRAHELLEEHPDVVRNLLYGELEAIEYIAEDAARAQQVVNDGIEAITDKRITDEVITAAAEPPVHRRPDRLLAAEVG